MHQLVIEGNVAAMREAVAQDPESVNQLNESGLPPLYTAALFRNRQAINFLLDMEQWPIFSPARIWARPPKARIC
jgi:hypothetical protein